MNKLNIPKEQLISNSDMTKFVEEKGQLKSLKF